MATLRQKIAAKKTVENGGNVSKAMREAKYSVAMSNNPQKLTQTKTWAELMEKYLPDNLLARRHKQLLNAKVKITTTSKKAGEVERTKTTTYMDNEAVGKGLDLAYKIKDKLKPTKIQIQSFVGWTPKELEAYAATGIIPGRFTDEGTS